MLSYNIWFSAPSFWMGGGLESRCIGCVYGADGAVHGTIRTVHTTYAAALKTTTHPKARCRKPYAATQPLMLLMMGICFYVFLIIFAVINGYSPKQHTTGWCM